VLVLTDATVIDWFMAVRHQAFLSFCYWPCCCY